MNAQKNGATMRKVLRYIRKYWFYFALSLFFAAVTVTLTLYLPILIGQAVDLILAPGQVDFEGIWRLLLLMGVMICIGVWFPVRKAVRLAPAEALHYE